MTFAGSAREIPDARLRPSGYGGLGMTFLGVTAGWG
jgi:hypothetical protein